ncbi:MAG TPA: histidine--tRNA ligase [Porphyromonadaceae bacterium]|nr:histidine--tRNA ligase [Porphyromonadaceae bacterium]
MAQKPSIPKGTRDFSPEEMSKRNYIFDTIRKVFLLHGFQQIETPAMEQLSTLMGKYGEEGDKLLFKILNSGNFSEGITKEDWENSNALQLANKFCEKGLRYDLTVPFARFVVMHRNDLVFPFKRFQIQPVWRADRPQKGRYREFFQCDADIVGTDSLLNEVELIQMIDEVFTHFGVRVAIKMNNRKILFGIAEIIGCNDKLIEITTAIDKIEKIGLEKVKEELLSSGMQEQSIEKLQPILLLEGNSGEKLETLKTILSSSQTGLRGIEELQNILSYTHELSLSSPLEIDLTLARGLNYYTGAIFEVKAQDVEIGSISGGGRYDNLTHIFGLDGVSGVGISFGADRIFDVLNQLDLYPKSLETTKILFICMTEEAIKRSLTWVSYLRTNGLSVELYPDCAKMKKQMNYANSRHIPFVAIVGESEIQNNKPTLKEMKSGEQFSLSIEEVVEKVK